MADAIPNSGRRCIQCGVSPISGRKYCSLKCRQDAHRKVMGYLPRAERIALAACHQVHTCEHCRAKFKPKRAANIRFCSRECGYARRKAAAAARLPADKKTGKCVDCSTSVHARSVRCIPCSIATARQARRPAPSVKTCCDCNQPTEQKKYQRRCTACALLHSKAMRYAQRHSPSVRASKARRKAMERGRTAGAERFDPIEVLVRDRWRCHICGQATPKALRGSYDDRAPELDHIVPLAAGGQHSRANTACACRKCNISKGATLLGQLRLFG
jgi:hypothetical protein